jgi:hypothetical protein
MSGLKRLPRGLMKTTPKTIDDLVLVPQSPYYFSIIAPARLRERFRSESQTLDCVMKS